MKCAFCPSTETVGGGYAICEQCKQSYHGRRSDTRPDWTLFRGWLRRLSEKLNG